MSYVIEPHPQSVAAISGGELFPVRRIFCVGKNYADHVKEMGGDAKSDPPVFFTKPADAVVQNSQSGQREMAIPYPQATDNLHFEGELVVALKAGGRDLSVTDDVNTMIFGYAAGCDLTRRDHQARAKKSGTPWDTAKGFDRSAPLGEIVPAAQAGDLASARLTTNINGETRQDAPLSTMIWSISEIIATLSQQFELKAGDLIFTGTPAGVGPLVPGDSVEINVGTLPPLRFSIVTA